MQTKNVITTIFHTTKKILLLTLLVVCSVILMTSVSHAQVTNPDGNYHFKNTNQRIYGDGAKTLQYHSNHGAQFEFSFFDKTNRPLGSLYGSSQEIGFKDSNGQYAYRANDTFTYIAVNGETKMRLMPNGYVGIGEWGGSPKAELHIGERLTMSSPTQTQTGWIGNNIHYLDGNFKRIATGGAAGISFDWEGSITFKTAMYGAGNSVINDFKYNMKILNTGGVNIDGGLILTSSNNNNNKSSTGSSIFRNQVHPVETDYEFFSIQVNSESANGFNLDALGRVIIGTNDPCQLVNTDTFNAYNPMLSVNGKVMKTGDAFWYGTSDKRLKKNITPMEKSLSKFMEIPLHGYEYKKSGSFRYGVMAQEMQDVFPHSVGKAGKSGEEYLTFNPNNLIFTGLKATQEIGKLVLEQQREINTLEVVNEELTAELIKAEKERNELRAEIDAIKVALAGYGTNPPQPTTAANSIVHINTNLPQLQQNIPNPFQQSTTISYYLPEDTQSATLLIHDITGKTIARHTLSTQKGEGEIQVNTDNIKLRGNYTYSLYVNNQHIDTKKMTLMAK